MAGIICPSCKTVDQYSSHQGGPGKGSDSWSRRKKCKVCVAIFETIEVPVGLITAGTEQPVAPVEATQPVQPVAPAEPVQPVAAAQPVVPVQPAVDPALNIFAPPAQQPAQQ